jgi:hypothetical protein
MSEMSTEEPDVTVPTNGPDVNLPGTNLTPDTQDTEPVIKQTTELKGDGATIPTRQEAGVEDDGSPKVFMVNDTGMVQDPMLVVAEILLASTADEGGSVRDVEMDVKGDDTLNVTVSKAATTNPSVDGEDVATTTPDDIAMLSCHLQKAGFTPVLQDATMEESGVVDSLICNPEERALVQLPSWVCPDDVPSQSNEHINARVKSTDSTLTQYMYESVVTFLRLYPNMSPPLLNF